jgi:hypothetical protein
LSFAATLAHGQDNHEIQLCGSDLVDPGRTMVELHSNFTIDCSKTIVEGVYPTNHAEHETVEITHGFNDWFECGFYIFTSITEGQSWQWGGRSHQAANCRPEEMPKDECRKPHGAGGAGKDYAPDYQFEPDKILPEWHGRSAAQRGLGTNLYRLGVPEKTIRAILRHANVSTTNLHNGS